MIFSLFLFTLYFVKGFNKNKLRQSQKQNTMKKRLLTYTALCLAMAFTLLACEKNDEPGPNPNPKPDPKPDPEVEGSLVSASIIGTIENFEGEGITLQWKPKATINLLFSGQKDKASPAQNVLTGANSTTAEGKTSTFSGKIERYSGTQTIYAVSPVTQFYFESQKPSVKISYPSTIVQAGKSTDHLKNANHLWASMKSHNMGDKGDQLQNTALKFHHLESALRFRIKNTDENKKFTLKKITVREEGTSAILWDNVAFNFENEIPKLAQSGIKSKEKIVEVKDADQIGSNEIFDAYIMVPALETKLSDDYRFFVKIEMVDETGAAVNREVEFNPAEAGNLPKNGLVAGKCYDLMISVNEFDMEGYYTINVNNAGSLRTLIEEAGLKFGDIKALKLTGKIDGSDFELMRSSLANLFKINLKDVDVKDDAIPSHAFLNNGNLKYIILPESVKIIKSYAFNNCSALTGDLIIPNSVTTIEPYTFYGCQQLNGKLVLSENLTTIGIYAFYRCGFTGDLTIPNGVKNIEDQVFYECRNFNGKLTIPDGVTTIGRFAFYSCGFTGDLTIPNSVKTINENAFLNCSKFNGKLTLSKNKKFEIIEESVFAGCTRLSGNLTIPDNVTIIRGSAFSGCMGFSGNLTIPNSVTTIGRGAFYGCQGFSGKLTLPDNKYFKDINESVFYNCYGLSGDLVIPNNVEKIYSSAFYFCRGFNGKLVLPENQNFKTISNGSFAHCTGFKGDLTIPASVTEIEFSAFEECNFSKVNLYWNTEAAILSYSDDWNMPNVDKTVPNGTKSLYEAKSWTKVAERN